MNTSRERVLAALSHREPDRVPVDLGAMDSTGITAIAYNRLKKHLGLAAGHTRIFDPYQQVVKVEESVYRHIPGDVRPLMPEPDRWKPVLLADGSAAEVPERWNPETQPDGSQVIRDAAGAIRSRMPAGGYYFEFVNPPLQHLEEPAGLDEHRALIENFDWPGFCDGGFEAMAGRAEALERQGQYAVMGNFAVHFFAAGQLLRGFEQFLVDLAINPEMVHGLLGRLADAYLERFERFHAALAGRVQVVNVNDDLGSQEGLLLSPALYRKLVRPYQERLYRRIRECGYHLFLHTDGSVYDLIPDFIEMGVDILNPVQFTCRNMELEKLKREFGRDLTFWGGGIDTQNVLPRATPAQVREAVKRSLALLAPGGGFVFNQVHNIQPDVPPENILAMYEAVREFGG
ncbi:MAG TPA: uroporphyrinogen decarboxylase family protein [bacterium]|nr:uroporphyrinogen decarboxylase family protein [bacterium]HNS49117.1 uroporphyrinogen decarboxylase family protein [bacterium]